MIYRTAPPRLLLGDNPFLGVNHASAEMAQEQGARFQNSDDIVSILQAAAEIGYGGFLCTVHGKLVPVFERIANSPALRDWPIAPAIPYAHKYSELIATEGVGGLVKQVGLVNTVQSAIRAFTSTLTGEPGPIMKGLIDSELRHVKKLNLSFVSLQNSVTDLLIGLGAHALLNSFARYIVKKYRTRPGFVTFNPEKLISLLDLEHLDVRPVVVTPVNPIGFRMFPSQADLVGSLQYGSKQVDYVAMSVLASGTVPPEEATKYLKSIPEIRSVVVGSSRVENLRAFHELYA
jgi:hypothetical protein